jgi:hypothetical protein
VALAFLLLLRLAATGGVVGVVGVAVFFLGVFELGFAGCEARGELAAGARGRDLERGGDFGRLVRLVC